jgi:hypothetical protein
LIPFLHIILFLLIDITLFILSLARTETEASAGKNSVPEASGGTKRVADELADTKPVAEALAIQKIHL